MVVCAASLSQFLVIGSPFALRVSPKKRQCRLPSVPKYLSAIAPVLFTVSSLGPLPEAFKDGCVDLSNDVLAAGVSVIIGPALNDWVKHVYQVERAVSFVGFDGGPDFLQD